MVSMVKRNRLSIILVTLFILPFLVINGCSDDSTGADDIDDGPPPPNFNISSITTTLVDGDPGILFRASSSTRVRLVQIVVTNPNNNNISYSPQGLIVQANEAFDLQEQGTAFYRWSGNWTFQFVGNHEPGGEEFDVTQTLSVSAKVHP